MNIWAIADLHLSFGVPDKKMDVFGEKWASHHDKIRKHWLELIHEDDLVLIAGDISWALRLEDVIPDLTWIDALPGIKVICKGNHDLWWKAKGKIEAILPKSIHLIQNDAFTHNGVTVGGARLWENPKINYSPFITFYEAKGVHVHQKEETEEERLHDEKVYKNELSRLAWSLDAMSRDAKIRIAMVHYPPTGPNHEPTEVTRLLENESVDYCLYGHLHNLKEGSPVNFSLGDVTYICTAADWLDFIPYKVASV